MTPSRIAHRGAFEDGRGRAGTRSLTSTFLLRCGRGLDDDDDDDSLLVATAAAMAAALKPATPPPLAPNAAAAFAAASVEKPGY